MPWALIPCTTNRPLVYYNSSKRLAKLAKTVWRISWALISLLSKLTTDRPLVYNNCLATNRPLAYYNSSKRPAKLAETVWRNSWAPISFTTNHPLLHHNHITAQRLLETVRGSETRTPAASPRAHKLENTIRRISLPAIHPLRTPLRGTGGNTTRP